jgi:hypothetical protein
VKHTTSFLAPHQHPQPVTRCDSDLAQYSNTPSLRVAGFEDEDEIPLGLGHLVYQFPKRGGGDFYDVAGQQSEIVRGYDTGTS